MTTNGSPRPAPALSAACRLALALPACRDAPQISRLESRVSISGQVVLEDIDGLNDTSRVLVDAGRGEGGSWPAGEEPPDYQPFASGSAFEVAGLQEGRSEHLFGPWRSWSPRPTTGPQSWR